MRIFLCALLYWFSSLSLACEKVYPITLDRVIDGDTIVATIDLGLNVSLDATIRVAGLDTPETWRPKSAGEKAHGLEATKRAKELLVGKLRLISCGYGVYNRVEGRLLLEDGRDFTQIMIDEGFEKRSNYDNTP